MATRGKAARIVSRIIGRMLDMRSHKISSFLDIAEDEGLGKKSLRRYVDAVSDASELSVVTFVREGERFWRLGSDVGPVKKRPMAKKCKGCGKKKQPSEFGSRPDKPDGKSDQCLKCEAEAAKRWRDRNRDQRARGRKLKYARNKDELNAKRRKKYAKNKEEEADKRRRQRITMRKRLKLPTRASTTDPLANLDKRTKHARKRIADGLPVLSSTLDRLGLDEKGELTDEGRDMRKMRSC